MGLMCPFSVPPTGIVFIHIVSISPVLLGGIHLFWFIEVLPLLGFTDVIVQHILGLCHVTRAIIIPLAEVIF